MSEAYPGQEAARRKEVQNRHEVQTLRRCPVLAVIVLAVWGCAGGPTISDASPATDAAASSPEPNRSLLAASDHSCVVVEDDTVACWGDNSAGGLGDGTTTGSATPVKVTGATSGVTAVVAGDRYSCARTTDAVTCWGNNEFGQLGDGTTEERHSPVTVAGLGGPTDALSARGEHTCALIGGRMACWGADVNGQLGDGPAASGPGPAEPVGLGSGVAGMAAGGEHTCAILVEGSVRCWGWNASGQVGDGTVLDRSGPVDVSELGSGVAAIAAGGRHTCALLTAGGVRCWGYNEFGQLGDGTTTDRWTPVDVAGLPAAIVAISLGGNFTCALARDGRVFCWGDDSGGQLGDGGSSERLAPRPVLVPGLPEGITAVAAGYYHVCAIAADATVVCWGANDSGQLGDGTVGDTGPPRQVITADGTPLAASP